MDPKILKIERKKIGLTQEQLAEKIGTSRSNVANWENGQNNPSLELLFKLSEIFNCDVAYLAGYTQFRNDEDNFAPIPEVNKDNIININFDNAQPYSYDISNSISIPVLGVIKAGIAIEAQENIIEYVDIPKSWLKGGKTFYGLKISGDSMYPKYTENDIVIFENTNDYQIANNKDCAVMVNGFDATFKNVNITNDGITLIPFNPHNSDGYQPTFYNKEQIENLPVKIVGIAREKRTRL